MNSTRSALAIALASSVAMAEPLTSPSQLNPGNQVIRFDGLPIAPLGVLTTIQCIRFSSPQGLSIVDLSSQPYSGPLVSGLALHPLPGAIGSGTYINISISFDPPVSEVGLGWWDPTTPGNLFRAFTPQGQILEDLTVPQQPPGGGGASFVGFRRATSEIGLVVCYPGASSDTYAIDNISFGPSCYANCDCSTNAPALNALDFGCFLNKFAAGDGYANCDGSTSAPTVNALDFGCFLNAFAAGCT